VSDTRQPYDARKAEEAALAREPAMVSRRRFPWLLAARYIAFAGAIAVMVILITQLVNYRYADSPIPLGLPYVCVVALTIGLWTIVGPLLWESPWRSLSWKISRSILLLVACAVIAPIAVGGIVGLIGLIGLMTQTS
jgi:hypothetical protein